jgi:hypothetical protein
MAESAVESGDGSKPGDGRERAAEPEASQGRKPPSLRMRDDRPLEDEAEDRLGFGVYVDALAELIDHPATHTPLTIALSAPWGAGKTSLAKLVERRLSAWRHEWGKPPHLVCWFNAWAHDDAQHLGAAFAAEVARTVDRGRTWWRRLLTPLPAAMLTPRARWRRRIAIAAVALVVALAVGAAPGVRDLFDGSGLGADLDAALGARLGSVALVLLAVLAIWPKLFATAEAAARFVDNPRSEAARGSMKEVTDELGELIHQATRERRKVGKRRKVVVFVDDLERCRPPRALEVCEVASNLLAHPGVVTVLIADMSVIASSAEMKYARLESAQRGAGRGADGAYGRLYLQKIVQIQFDLPAPTDDGVRDMLREEAESDPGLHQAPMLADLEAAMKRVGSGVDRRRQFRETLDSVLIGLYLLATIGVAVFFAVRPPESSDDRISAAFTGALGFSVVILLLAALVRGIVSAILRIVGWIYALRARRRLEQIDDEIAHRARNRAAAQSPQEVESDVLRKQGVAAGSREATLVHSRVTRYFTQESALVQEAEDEIVGFLPRLPRSAKRMMNHLRLWLYVAIERGLLGEGSEFRPAHLGKWVVLEERWPDLARHVKERPRMLADLERLGGDELRQTLGELELDPSDELVNFLGAEPNLGPLVEQLIFLDPTPARRPASAATAAPASAATSPRPA